MLKNSLSILSLIISSSAYSALQLEAVHPIENSEQLNLSGLAICNGNLLTISDKISNKLFQIDHKSNTYSINAIRTITIPENKTTKYKFPNKFIYWVYSVLDNDNYDWEGIACDENNIYLISERHSKILSVGENKIEWININTFKIEISGLLDSFGAFIEGITLDDNNFYLALEREPRGIVSIDRATFNKYNVVSYDNHINNSTRPDDAAGLSMWNDTLYMVSRNKEEICHVEKTSLSIINCFSYKEAIKRIEYESDKFGVVEGLTITDDYIYLIIDNNGMSIKGTVATPQACANSIDNASISGI
ncbi:MAG: hypothetical protein QM500_12975 [Methylococcales bacterium]